MLRFVALIRTVLVILSGKYDKRVASFKYGLLFIEVMNEFSFRYDKDFDVVAVRMVKRCGAGPDMKRKIFLRLKHSRGPRLFYVWKKVVRSRFRKPAFPRDIRWGGRAILRSIFVRILHNSIVPPCAPQVKRKSKK